MTDIVERLRHQSSSAFHMLWELCLQASSEIEQLLADNAALKLQLGVGGFGDVVTASAAAVRQAIVEMNKAIAERDALLVEVKAYKDAATARDRNEDSMRAERDALRALLMRAKDVLNDVAYPDGDLCVNADAEEMASSIDAALRGADKLAEGRDEN